MSFSAHYLFAILLTIFGLPTSLWAQSAPKQPLRIARGSISGRVTINEKGVFGVAVALRKNEPSNTNERIPRAITDQEGFYRIANIAPGTYEVMPVAPAFVPSDPREQRGKTVLVGEDENVENINFTLMRGGVITGRVTDADGRPVIQQQVSIYRAADFDQRRGQRPPTVYAAGGAPTDDRGIYRVFGLLPGSYKVSVGRGEDTFGGSFGATRSNYTQVFHPDATDQTKATVIEVGEGSEAENVDISLGRALQTFTMSGRVVDGEKGLPVPNVRLTMQRHVGQRLEYVSTVFVSNSHGDFVAPGLIAGKYTVGMFSNENSGLRTEPLTVDIIDQDVSGVTVKLIQGASVSGVVVLEPSNPTALAKFSELRLRAVVNNTSGVLGQGSTATSPIGPNGTFLLAGLPGGVANVTLTSTTSQMPPKGFTITRMERDGMVMRGVQLTEGEQVTGLRVILTYGNATLRGVVAVENGELPSNARIWINLLKPGERPGPGNIRPSQVDARGHFLIEGIPAGTYEVRATVVASPQMPPPRFAKREVTLQDGVATDIVLTIDMNPPVNVPAKP